MLQSPHKGNLSVGTDSEMASIKDREELVEQDNALIESRTQGDSNGFDLPPEHKQYLLQRHGTANLDPVPQPDDNDPYNWPYVKASPSAIPIPLVPLD